MTICFHKASGLRDGQNFDLLISGNGKMFPAEVKCKIEASDLSKGQIINKLKHARSQLPDEEQSVILLRTPGVVVFTK